MKDRDLFFGAVDLLLVFGVLFMLGFFAVQRDADQGTTRNLVAVEQLDARIDGDFAALHFLGVEILERGIVLREFRRGKWVEGGAPRTIITSIDLSSLTSVFLSRGLPVVIYEKEREDQRFSDVVRAAVRAGMPVGIGEVRIGP